jgi:hypothetical protein
MNELLDDRVVYVRPLSRPRVFSTIAGRCGSKDCSVEMLFEQHDVVNGHEVELQLGIES